MKVLIVDGSNIVMRASFGGDMQPPQSTPIAMGMIERAYRELEATHLVVVFDCPGVETWRKKIYPEYKANRTTDTRPWIDAAVADWSRSKWWIESVEGFEADDVIATIAAQAQEEFEILVLSSDSDLLQISSDRVCVCKPVNGGGVSAMTEEMVCQKYGIGYPELIVDFKAMVGEDGDNVPGVEGVGPVKAAQLLNKYGTLGDIIAAGKAKSCKLSASVFAQAETAQLAHRLISLDKVAPVVNLKLKLLCLASGQDMIEAKPMSDDEQSEFFYHYVERLGILCGNSEPDQEQVNMAIDDGRSAVEKMRI